ncbi:nudix hydrolase 20, chloroplastic isoform X1 [Cannabis sativa]|uniref:nudix hydrolase 20, chloroplastic isoform X1 n=1 Tax=Cannabis sativa TaxID=3483 RepID=UPI0029C9F92B|nr:nudix hydrolase 20, chloroplastic isoform X1 [Cannabis sativa]
MAMAMACNIIHLLHFHPTPYRAFARTTLTTAFRIPSPFQNSLPKPISPPRSLSTTATFTWDDVLRLSQPQSISDSDDVTDLNGYFEKIKMCNRGSEMRFMFMPFVIENQIIGYIHNGFAENLRKFQKVFKFLPDNSNDGFHGGTVTLHPSLKTQEDRTRAVGEVVKILGEQQFPGIRNELYPVISSFGASPLFSLERAAAPYFGIKAYGIHMNGYVEKEGEKFLWIGKRSQEKSTFPGMLDHLVAGGLPHGIACGENVVKECQEEAGIPKSISSSAISVGAVSYMDIDGYRYKRDVLFCYDLKLPESFIPKNEDGEVESFKLIPVAHVANVIRRTSIFKPNCCLVIIDFLFRHGYIRPENYGYLDLLQSLRSGDYS